MTFKLIDNTLHVAGKCKFHDTETGVSWPCSNDNCQKCKGTGEVSTKVEVEKPTEDDRTFGMHDGLLAKYNKAKEDYNQQTAFKVKLEHALRFPCTYSDTVLNNHSFNNGKITKE